MALDIGRELATLKQMTVRELREKYEQVFGEPRAGNKDFLFKRIAWRIQSLAEGDLSERARRRAEVLARDADLRTTAPRTPLATTGGNGAKDAKPAPSLDDERVPPPGTVLTRAYRGQAYHVVVRDNGFEYDGQVFLSLSAIAKVITGSHWNGLLFFKIAKPKMGRVARAAKPKSIWATSNVPSFARFLPVRYSISVPLPVGRGLDQRICTTATREPRIFHLVRIAPVN